MMPLSVNRFSTPKFGYGGGESNAAREARLTGIDYAYADLMTRYWEAKARGEDPGPAYLPTNDPAENERLLRQQKGY